MADVMCTRSLGLTSVARAAPKEQIESVNGMRARLDTSRERIENVIRVETGQDQSSRNDRCLRLSGDVLVGMCEDWSGPS